MKKSLFIPMLAVATASYSHATDYTLHNGDIYDATVVKTDSSQFTTASEHNVILKSADGKATWTGNTIFSIQGLYLADGAGIKFNHSSDVTVEHLYLGEGIAFQTGTGNVAGAVNWSTAGHKLVISSAEGAYADIDSDVGKNIKVGSMDNGSLYLNAKGYIDTTGATLADTNTVYATYGPGTTHTSHAKDYYIDDSDDASVISLDHTATRTLLAGNYDGWEGTVELDGFAEDATVNKTATGLSVSYVESRAYATRNGEAISVSAVRMDSGKIEAGESYLILKSADGKASWTGNDVFSIQDLYVEDGAGLKFNHFSDVTVEHLHLGEGISFQTGTGNVAGAINWSDSAHKLVISSEAGAYVDVDSDVGANIRVNQMDGGDVYLNTKGYIDTTGATLGSSNTVHATYGEERSGRITFSGLSLAEQGVDKSVIRVHADTINRQLLAGNYAGWEGTVELDGFAEDATVNKTATGLSVTYGGYVTYATRNGEAFEAAALKSDSYSLTDGTQNYLVLKSADGKSTWTPNNVSKIQGLYLEDGAGIKFNHWNNVEVTYLHIGDGISFKTGSTNTAGAINWSPDGGSGSAYSAKLVISGTTGAYVDLDFDAGSNISLANMANGDVYLNQHGHIASTLGSSNTVHAVLAIQEGVERNYTLENGHLSLAYSRTLLTGNFSGWNGTVDFRDDNGAAFGTGNYSLTANGSGLNVDYRIDIGAVYGEVSNIMSDSGIFDLEGRMVIRDVRNLSFRNNRADNSSGETWAGAAALSCTGDLELTASGAVVFDNNVAVEDSMIAGAVNADSAYITAASLSMTRNHSDVDGGAVVVCWNADLTTTEGDMTLTGNTAASSGGAISAWNNVNLDSAGNLALSNNRATDNGGAIYADADITLHAANGMEIKGNHADNGGALYSSYGSISLSSDAGDITVSGNSADSTGGAIKVDTDGASVSLSATGGDITFSGNTDSTGANDITFSGTGTLNLTAEEGCTITLNGGVNGADDYDAPSVVDIAINQGGETGTVVFGGESVLAHNTTVSGGKLIIKDGAVLGREPLTTFSVRSAGSSGSTFTAIGAEVDAETAGTGVINADNLTLTDSKVDGIVSNVADAAEITGSTLTQTVVNAETSVTITGSVLTETLVQGTGGTALVLDGATVRITDLENLVAVFSGFGSVSGTVVLDITMDALQAAVDSHTSVSINLFDADTVVSEGDLTLQFSDALAWVLDKSAIDHEIAWAAGTGVYNIDFTDVERLIPEPATSTLGLMALAMLCARRRRK